MVNRQASTAETEAVDAGPGTGPAPAGAYPFENATMANAIGAGGSGAVPAQVVAAVAADGGIQAATRLVERTSVGGGTPAELVDSHTSWGALDEDRLGADLLTWAVRGDHRTVEAALDMLGATDRDDVAVAMARAATDAQLAVLSRSSGGQALLSRMFDELTSGSVGKDEQEQADRVLHLKAQGIDPSRVAKEMLTGLVFPFKLPGLTVFHDAPIIAERRPEGMVWVHQPVRVLAADAFREETGTLPTRLFSLGVLLPEDQVIGVKLYDVDEKVVYRPALFLIQLANEGSTATAGTLAEIVGIGLTFGTGALAGVGAKATLAARVLLGFDRAATALAMITMVLDEHRGMIVSRFGEAGALFVHCVDLVASATAMYGFGRVVVEMAQLVQALRAAYRSWRSAVRAAEKDLSDSDGQAVQQISEETENLFDTADEIGAETPAGPTVATGPAPTPAGPAAAGPAAGPTAAPATAPAAAPATTPAAAPVATAQGPAAPGGTTAARTVAPEDDYDFTAADKLRDPVRDAHHVRLRQMALDSMAASGPNQPVKVVPASYTPMTEAKGYITTAKFVLGRTPEQISEILGQRALANGVTVYALDRSAITLDNLNTRGLTQSPDGKHPSRSTPANLQNYPVGTGAPQWSLSDNVPAVEVGRALPGQRLTFSPTN